MARITTPTYVTQFAAFRDKHFKNGQWERPQGGLGAVFVVWINKTEEVSDPYPDGPDGYEALKSKHNLTRGKIKRDHMAAINQQFGVVEFVGRKAVTTHLSPDDVKAYQKACDDLQQELDSKIPRLPRYDGSLSGTTAISGQQLLNLL